MNFRFAALTAIWCLLPVMYAQQKHPSRPASIPSSSAETVYRNPSLGFRYRISYGWVDRTENMQGDVDTAKGTVLLAVFERPPQAAGDTINSAVVVAAENVANFPGLKTAEDYVGPLTEITTSKGFEPEGDPSEIEIDHRRLIRVDFTKPLNDKLTMHQSTLVLLARRKVVSFTFVADSADAIDSLIEGLDFTTPKSPAAR